MTSSALAMPRGGLARHPWVERYAPLATTLLVLLVIWYVAAVAMNLSLVRGGFEREETAYTLTDLIYGTMSAERPLLPAPHQVAYAFLDGVFGYPPLAPRSLIYHSLVTITATLLGFFLGALLGIGPDPGAGTDLHRRARRARTARAAAEVDHLGVSVLLSDRDRNGQGVHVTRSAANGVDADMVGNAAPDAVEAALALRGAFSLRQPEGRHHHLADRGHRRRIADRGGSRHRCAAIGRLLLRPDHPDLGRAGRLRRARLRTDRDCGPGRARRRSKHGGALMDPSKFRLGFLLAAGAIALALLLPSGPRPPTLMASPVIWQATVGAGLMFLFAAWLADARAVAFGLIGAVIAAGASLAMLRDPAVAGSAGTGFWMIVIAVW